jgi:hypothetical protein
MINIKALKTLSGLMRKTDPLERTLVAWDIKMDVILKNHILHHDIKQFNPIFYIGVEDVYGIYEDCIEDASMNDAITLEIPYELTKMYPPHHVAYTFFKRLTSFGYIVDDCNLDLLDEKETHEIDGVTVISYPGSIELVIQLDG